MNLTIFVAIWLALGLLGTLFLRHWFKRDLIWDNGDFWKFLWPMFFGPLWLMAALVLYWTRNTND